MKFPYFHLQKHRTTWLGVQILAAMFIVPLCAGQQLRDDQLARQAAAVAASSLPPKTALASTAAIAGEYSFGNGFNNNVSLTINPDATFDYKRYDCESVLEESTGTISLKNDRIYLAFAKKRTQWPHGMDEVLVPVPWGQRLYLIPDNDFIGFCNVVNRGSEPVSQGSMGNYYLREGDWDRDATGQPQIPAQYRPYLLKTPPQGKVIRQESNGDWLVDFGANTGAYVGLEVTAWSPDRHRFTTLRLNSIGADVSRSQNMMPNSSWNLTNWTVVTRTAEQNP